MNTPAPLPEVDLTDTDIALLIDMMSTKLDSLLGKMETAGSSEHDALKLDLADLQALSGKFLAVFKEIPPE